jgi:hypothetical protein
MAVSGYILWARKSNNLTLTRYIKEELINNWTVFNRSNTPTHPSLRSSN